MLLVGPKGLWLYSCEEACGFGSWARGTASCHCSHRWRRPTTIPMLLVMSCLPLGSWGMSLSIRLVKQQPLKRPPGNWNAWQLAKLNK